MWGDRVFAGHQRLVWVGKHTTTPLNPTKVTTKSLVGKKNSPFFLIANLVFSWDGLAVGRDTHRFQHCHYTFSYTTKFGIPKHVTRMARIWRQTTDSSAMAGQSMQRARCTLTRGRLTRARAASGLIAMNGEVGIAQPRHSSLQ